MVNLLLASAAITLFSGASASAIALEVRNEEPAQPSCTNFTPFKYAGCYQDLSVTRALLYQGPFENNMTVETCVAFCKGNEYKYAGVEYYNECFCGDSVNGPQVDESFCTYPCAGDATETCGGTDYINIYQDTTFPTVDNTIITDYKHLGCYSEGSSGRSLAWRQDQVPLAGLTIETCLLACKLGGYPFAGVEFGQECYCGVVLGNGTAAIDSSACSMGCTGNSSEICGGSGSLNLYFASDLESTQPCNGGSVSSSSSVVTSTTTSSSRSIAPPTTTPSSKPSTPATTSTKASTSSTASSIKLTSSPASSIKLTSSPASSITVPTTTPATSATLTPPSLCTSTIISTPTPSCEYKCGNWCSKPMPTFTDRNSCSQAVSACAVQVASCFLNAGFPASLNCFEYSSWCNSISSYCGNYCPGNNCSPSGCRSKYPPSGYNAPVPTTSTSVYLCPTSSVKPSTTAAPTTTTSSVVPVPTNSNICTQPNNPNRGYSSSSPVGNIQLPCLTCNNVRSDFNSGNCFKLYTNNESSKCPSYGRGHSQQGCKDACDSQYNTCMSTYAEGCRSNSRGDTYGSASQKCYYQWQDCYAQNQYVSPSSGRCGSFNQGWY